ncbi:hypothetical protein TNCV_1205271 [Trichonephila clavipes]|nr:hypothetical protein TNCV_1205271 [Trichonephila clavipes]
MKAFNDAICLRMVRGTVNLLQPNIRVSSLKRLDSKFVPRSVVVVGHPNLEIHPCIKARAVVSAVISGVGITLRPSSKSINDGHAKLIAVEGGRGPIKSKCMCAKRASGRAKMCQWEILYAVSLCSLAFNTAANHNFYIFAHASLHKSLGD